MRLLHSIHGIQCKKNIHFSKELIMRFLCDKIESVWKILLKRTGDFVADVLTKEQRHKNMKNIRSKDTKIEVILRKALWKKGYRYRKNYKKLPDSNFLRWGIFSWKGLGSIKAET